MLVSGAWVNGFTALSAAMTPLRAWFPASAMTFDACVGMLWMTPGDSVPARSRASK